MGRTGGMEKRMNAFSEHQKQRNQVSTCGQFPSTENILPIMWERPEDRLKLVLLNILAIIYMDSTEFTIQLSLLRERRNLSGKACGSLAPVIE